jgi:threonine/homoserine/homoserine lactone efflux protein
MPIVFSSMQLASSIFLAYLAYSLWMAKEYTHSLDGSHAKGFTEGFLFAFLNPKIALFMLAVLSSVLDENMSIETKIIIGFLGFFFDIAWYVIVATFLSSSLMISRIQSKQLLMNKVTALVMIAMAVWVWVRFVI